MERQQFSFLRIFLDFVFILKCTVTMHSSLDFIKNKNNLDNSNRNSIRIVNTS